MKFLLLTPWDDTSSSAAIMVGSDLFVNSGLEGTYSNKTFYSEALSKKNVPTLTFLLFTPWDDTNFSGAIMGGLDLPANSGLEGTYSNKILTQKHE